jgi:hypothetical protein
LLQQAKAQRLAMLSPSEKKRTILSDPGTGPQILFLTDMAIVGSNYHRNNEGYNDQYRFRHFESHKEAWELVQKRHIGLIAVCDGWRDEEPYIDLLLSSPPPWVFERIDLSDSESGLLVYEVNED